MYKGWNCGKHGHHIMNVFMQPVLWCAARTVACGSLKTAISQGSQVGEGWQREGPWRLSCRVHICSQQLVTGRSKLAIQTFPSSVLHAQHPSSGVEIVSPVFISVTQALSVLLSRRQNSLDQTQRFSKLQTRFGRKTAPLSLFFLLLCPIQPRGNS